MFNNWAYLPYNFLISEMRKIELSRWLLVLIPKFAIFHADVCIRYVFRHKIQTTVFNTTV